MKWNNAFPSNNWLNVYLGFSLSRLLRLEKQTREEKSLLTIVKSLEALKEHKFYRRVSLQLPISKNGSEHLEKWKNTRNKLQKIQQASHEKANLDIVFDKLLGHGETFTIRNPLTIKGNNGENLFRIGLLFLSQIELQIENLHKVRKKKIELSCFGGIIDGKE